MTEQHRPPLFGLFTRLRQAGLPLGIDEYTLLLTALEAGFGTLNLASLSNLCKTLWVKSDSDLRTFEQIFYEFVYPQEQDRFPGDDPLAAARKQDTRSPTGPLSDKPFIPADSSSNSAQRTEQQAVQAILHMSAEEALANRRFVRHDEYFPITRRQMKQSWRRLRHPVRQGLPTELNIEKTLEEIGRTGLLLEPALLPRYTNRAEVLLLIDQGGSMVPFHALSARLAQTAQYGGRLTNIGIYYFRNYPTDTLFRTPSHQKDIPLKEVLEPLHYDRSSALIFSDAGAARGYFSRGRSEGTRLFLKKLAAHVRYQAWLNPLPEERWTDTTAQSIQQYISMFDMNRNGLEHAINALRGRYLFRRIA